MGTFWKCTLPQTSHKSWFFRGKYWVYVSIQAAGHAAVVPRWNNSGKVPCRDRTMVRRPMVGWKKTGKLVWNLEGKCCWDLESAVIWCWIFKLTSYFDSGIDVLSCFFVVQSNFIDIYIYIFIELVSQAITWYHIMILFFVEVCGLRRWLRVV